MSGGETQREIEAYRSIAEIQDNGNGNFTVTTNNGETAELTNENVPWWIRLHLAAYDAHRGVVKTDTEESK